MTECSGKIIFSRVLGRAVEADFAGGELTSDAGGVLLHDADRRMGLTQALAEVISDPRDPARIVHSVKDMLRQRVYAIALGYEDGNDHQQLRNDPLLRLLCERDEQLGSPPTLCRFENFVNRASLWRMADVLVEKFITSHSAPPQELILDFDATDFEIHGGQELRFFHGYYDCYCFLPLYVFCDDQLLCAYLRPSKIDAAKHAWAILALLAERLRRAWPEVRLIFRGDSSFARWKMLRWCERHDIGYIVGLARNARLQSLGAGFMQSAREKFEATGEKQRVLGEFQYAADSWDKPRRVVARAEYGEQGENPRFVVTNLAGTPAHLYEDVYCAREEMENRIKEQLMLFADRVSDHRFAANQLRVLLAATAYVLVEHIRRVALAETELKQAQADTIRLKLFKIGARITRSARRIVLHLSASYPYQDLLRTAAARLAVT